MVEGEPRMRHPQRRIDWRHAAELLARGLNVAAVARRVGCSRSQVSRKRNQDPVFQGWIEEFEAKIEVPSTDRMVGLRRALHEAIDAEVRAGNVRVILWVADRVKLLAPEERPAEQELRDLLGGLSPDELREFESLRDPS